MRVLAVIPARGGSKGLVGKNTRLLGGKPLIQYTLETAHKCKCLDKVIVSTDSQYIADLVISLGGNVPFLRPAALAQDNTPTLPVIQHALSFFSSRDEQFDAVCILQPTTPFRDHEFIDAAITQFSKSGCDSLISVLPVPDQYNPHWVFVKGSDGLLQLATGEKEIISRRQDLPRAFFRDGSLYLTKASVLNMNSLYGDHIGYIESDPQWYVNIDGPEDWEVAEKLVNRFQDRCAP